MGRAIRDLLPWLALPTLALVCFGRLAASPGSLIADPARASVDLAYPGQARGVGNDLTSVFLPRYLTIVDHLKTNRSLPVWDDSGFGGRPLVGNPQAGLFYPPVWLAWVVDRPSALGWLTVAHLVFAGAGTYLLARGLGLAPLASTVAAGCFQGSPYLLAHTFEGHYPHVWSVCWYPWAFWAMLGARRGEALGTLALPVVLALAFLCGHLQEWYYLVVALSVWVAVDVVQRVRQGDRWEGVRWGAAWFGLLSLGLAVCAVELLPDLSARAWTLRSGRIALRQIDRYHLHALNLLQLLSPSALGGPADYFGHDNYWETVFSAGLVPLILAAVGLARHPRRGVVRAWFGLALIASVCAGGRKLGLYALAYHLLPGMDLFRVPSRTLFLASLAVSVLVGYGVDVLLGGHLAGYEWVGLRRRVVAAVALVALWIAGLSLAGGATSGALEETGGRVLAGGSPAKARTLQAARAVATDPTFWTAAVGMSLAWYGFKVDPRGRKATVYALSALALLELGWDGHKLLKVAPASAFHADETTALALKRVKDEPSGPVRVASVGTLLGDLGAARHGLEKTNVNDGFQVQIAADLYERLYPLLDPLPPSRSTGRAMDSAVAEFQDRVVKSVLDRMSVRYLVTDRPPPFNGLEAVFEPRVGVAVYRNPGALPRAYVVPRAVVVKDDPWTVAARLDDVGPREFVLMRRDPLAGLGGDRQPYTPARWLGGEAGRRVIGVETSRPGLLVVGETWMPGWRATVDGVKTPVLRGNHCQQVVPLTSGGRHTVVLKFDPPGLRRGAMVTASACSAWGLLALALAWGKGPSPGLRPPSPERRGSLNHSLSRRERVGVRVFPEGEKAPTGTALHPPVPFADPPFHGQ